MGVLSFVTIIDKFVSVISKLIDSNNNQQANLFLKEYLYLYVTLGELYQSGIKLNELVQDLLENTGSIHSDVRTIERLLISRTSTISDIEWKINKIGHSIFLLDSKDDSIEYWSGVKELGVMSQKSINDLIIFTGKLSSLRIDYDEDNKDGEFSLVLPIPTRNYRIFEYFEINSSSDISSIKIKKKLDKFYSRKSLTIIKESQQRLKKIIHLHWDSEKILSALEVPQKRYFD